PAYGPQNDVTLKMPAFEWVHVQLHQQKGMISLSPPTICNSALTLIYPMRCPVMEFPAKCQGRLYDLQRDMSINSKFNPILTQFTHGI
ncbi:hypothetical protein, partial [Escherichia coli]|nr:hypothetical protein [Salmonella enterica subsp. enterica serovar Typhimurium]